MQKLLLAGLLLLCFGQTQAQYPFFLDAGNKKLVMKTLFDGKVNDSDEVVWKPDFNERLNFHVSDNGMCYTKIDTIFNYADSAGDKFTLYLFTTNRKSKGKYVHYHHQWLNISTALFATYKYTPCQLETFNKHLTDCGDYGFPAGRRLVKMGGKHWALMFSDCGMRAGILNCWESLYLVGLRHFPKVFNLITDKSNSGHFVGKVKSYKYVSETKFVPGKNGYDDIVVISNGTLLNDNKKIIPVIPKRVFWYNQNTESYTMVYP